MKRDRGTAGKPPSENIRKVKMKPAWLLAAVMGVTFCAYSNSFGVPFLLDNDEIILKDPRVHAATSVQLHRILTQQYWETATTGLYRPLTTLSYLFNYTMLGNGANPEGYHWLNLILHMVNVGLVYLLGMAIFEQVSAALLLSALWGLHPLQTEAVTNIVGRADLLAACGVLAALLCHRKALESFGARKAAWLAAIVLAVTCGMFAKESGIVVLAVLPIYDLAFARGTSWRARVPSYLAALAPCAVYLYVRAGVLAGAPYLATAYTDNPLLGAGFWTARATAVKVIGKYFLLMLWPVQLSYDYSYNQIPLVTWTLSAWENSQAAIALIGCLAAVVVAIRSWRGNRALFFGIAFFFATLAPASNVFVVIGSIMGERLLYLPLVGFAVCAVCAIRAAQPRYRRWVMIAMGVVLVGYAARTYDRNGDWLDPYRFWRTGAEAAPSSYKTHINVVTNVAGLTQDDWDRGIREAGRALAILEPLPDSRNVGRAYRDAALFYREVGERLASKNPAGAASVGTTPEFWFRKSLAELLRSERIELVFDEDYRKANERRGRPGLTAMPSKLYLEMGRTYMRLKDLENALAAFERGRTLESSPELLEELAEAYRQAGDPHSAAIALDEAYTVDSNRPQLLGKLVEMYAAADPKGCAVSRDGGGAALNPDCPMVHTDICMASRNIVGTYVRRGQPFEAAAVRKRAVEYLGCAPESVQ